MAKLDSDDDAAARWAIRLDAGVLDPAGQDALERWLDAGQSRPAALLRAQAALSYLDRGRALAGPVEGYAPDRGRTASVDRRGVLAAGLSMAAAAAGLLLWSGRGEVFDAGVGELRRVPLPDGSLATLNTRTRVAVAMTEHQRTVRLENGEAWFRVAHDTARPFVVEAGEVRVRAVGTAFSVRRRSSGADVLVTEGVVKTWVVGREGDTRLIAAGSRGFVPRARADVEVTRAPQDIDRALAWRGGELALAGERLSYAVEELNRYNVRQIVVADPRLGNEPLVGYFRTTEPENFARAVSGMIGGTVIVEGDTIRIQSADL